MRILIAGVDGYLGWPLAQYLSARGHIVAGADCFLRRQWVKEMGSWSALPVPPMEKRLEAFKRRFNRELPFWKEDLRDWQAVDLIFRQFQPDAIVHLAECPSAPFSMMSPQHAVLVQTNNITTTLNLLFAMRQRRPEAHLVKLGTMGEYGTPNLDIPEGFFKVSFRGRVDRLPFPRQAWSWYHWSKVHGSNNVMFASRVWGLRATDIMQGVVFGTRWDDEESQGPFRTRLDFDQAFGTIINRFCCEAVLEHPLTLYGNGLQKRSFIPLKDAMRCLTLALENPPQRGEYRVFNQFQGVYALADLAARVSKSAARIGLACTVRKVENPRLEVEGHYYNPSHRNLSRLGYRPSRDMQNQLSQMIDDLLPYRERIRKKAQSLWPDVWWDGIQRRASDLEKPEAKRTPP